MNSHADLNHDNCPWLFVEIITWFHIVEVMRTKVKGIFNSVRYSSQLGKTTHYWQLIYHALFLSVNYCLPKKTGGFLNILVSSKKELPVATKKHPYHWETVAAVSLAVQLDKVHLVCLLDDLPLELEGSRDEAWLRRPWLRYQLNFGWDLKFL